MSVPLGTLIRELVHLFIMCCENVVHCIYVMHTLYVTHTVIHSDFVALNVRYQQSVKGWSVWYFVNASVKTSARH